MSVPNTELFHGLRYCSDNIYERVILCSQVLLNDTYHLHNLVHNTYENGYGR
jgi:hypothetical protein